jgi:hypothetical protein
MASVESGSHELSQGPVMVAVQGACNEIELALAETAVCLEFLGAFTTEVSRADVTDATVALQRINVAVGGLREICGRASSAGGRSATP